MNEWMIEYFSPADHAGETSACLRDTPPSLQPSPTSPRYLPGRSIG